MKERTDFKHVIIVTGTPGVGKTTVSTQLATKLHAHHVDLADLVKHERLTSGYDKTRRTLIADNEKLAKRLKQMIAEQKDDIIIDGHYASVVVPKHSVSKAFVLRCHPRQLKKRMEERGFKGAKLWENLAAEILDVCLYEAIMSIGPRKVCEIDTTDTPVEEVVDRILLVLDVKKACSAGMIDWLGTLERENSLDQYLKHF